MTENTEYFSMLKRMIKAASVRCINSDAPDLSEYYSFVLYVNDSFTSIIQEKNRLGLSWEEIGWATGGISRQGAYNRYGKNNKKIKESQR